MTTVMCSGPVIPEAACTTCSIRVRPPARCRTFACLDFIRVPKPAAKITTLTAPLATTLTGGFISSPSYFSPSLFFSENPDSAAVCPAAPRQIHCDLSGNPGIMADYFPFGQKIGGHNLQAHRRQPVHVIHYRLRLFGRVFPSLADRDTPCVHHRHVEQIAAGVAIDGCHVVRSPEPGGLARLPHQVHEISLQRPAAANCGRNTLHQYVRNHAGEERSRTEGDQIGAL